MSEPRRITFPHMGDYWVAVKSIAELSGCEVVVPPKITRRTIELGALNSPEFVCVPFKYNLGNFIEALDRGANVICQVGGGCRFSYYAEIQETILRDLGYDFEFVRFEGGSNILDIVREFRDKAAPHVSMARVAACFWHAFHMGEAIDAVQDFIRKNVGFEATPGAMRSIEARFLHQLDGAKTRRYVDDLLGDTLALLRAVPLQHPERRLRVQVVGELYVVMEPFSNYRVEDELARNGVEVHRHLDLTTLIRDTVTYRSHVREMLRHAAPYVTYHLGAEGTESVARTLDALRGGFDGAVHLKPFGCMPEVNAMTAMQRISREHTFPILFVSCDAQAAETGLRTRVEAFVDMLRAREAGLINA